MFNNNIGKIKKQSTRKYHPKFAIEKALYLKTSNYLLISEKLIPEKNKYHCKINIVFSLRAQNLKLMDKAWML